MEPRAELAWKLADYKAHSEEAPQRVIDNPDKSEGQMMSDEEIQDYIQLSVKTIMVLRDQNSWRFKDVHASFLMDMAYLVKIGRLDKSDYNELIDPNNFSF